MNHRFLLTAAALVLTAGCVDKGSCPFSGCNHPRAPGGGGGGGGSGGGGLMTIDETNALPALREAWFAAMTSAEIPYILVATGVGDDTNAVPKVAPRVTVAVDPAGPTTYNCPVSGTFMVSGNVADPNTVTTGDFATYESSACDSGAGYTVDGTYSIDIASFAGDINSGQFIQDESLTFTDFQAAAQSLVTTLNGDHMAVIDTQTADSITTSFSGSSLDVDEDQISISISNYSGIAFVQTISPFRFTLETDGNASSTNIAGSFNYSTNELIEQDIGNNPFNGILDIFGEGPGTARIAVVDETTVDIQVDANGSTNYEISVSMTWDEFLNGTGVLQ